MLMGVALWSIGTLVAPSAAHISLLALCVTRAVVRSASSKHNCLTWTSCQDGALCLVVH